MKKFSEWYDSNVSLIQFDDVIIRCMRDESEHCQDMLFKCRLKWKDALRLFGEYNLMSIRQGRLYEGHTDEDYCSIQCTIYPNPEEDKEVD